MNLLGAPTNLGNRPYEDTGQARLTTLAPATLRRAGIVERLAARDLGDVVAAPYRDFVRPKNGIRNEELILDHLTAVSTALQAVDLFTLVLAGDCSVLPACITGLRRTADVGLVYIDAHSDLGTAVTSETGGAAGMALAFVTGRDSSRLAQLAGPSPPVKDEHVVAVGVRDGDFGGTQIRTAQNAREIAERLGSLPFFIHLDVDVLDPSVMPWVDSPEPGGMTAEELIQILGPLVQNPLALGMQLAIYDPREDEEARGAALLVQILGTAFGQ